MLNRLLRRGLRGRVVSRLRRQPHVLGVIPMVGRHGATDFVLVVTSGIGADIEAGKTSLADLEKYALSNEEPMVASGRQEVIESIINDCI